MATLVIDTNALVFAITGSPQLSRDAAALLRDQTNRRLVCAASFYEIALKHVRGRLPVHPDDARRAVRLSRLELALANEDVMIVAATLDWDNRDPWDRVIAATALELDAPVVTSDRAFETVPGLTRLW